MKQALLGALLGGALLCGCRKDSSRATPTASASASPSGSVLPRTAAALKVSDTPQLTLATAPAAPVLCLEDDWCWRSPLPQGNGINGLWASERTTWAVGKHGTLLRHDGQRWAAEASGTEVELTSVSGTSDTDVWAVGDGGTVLRYDGKQWRKVASPTKDKFGSVWALGPGRAVMVGGSGLVVLCEAKCSTEPAVTSTELKAVWGQGDQIFAVGRDGIIVRGDKGKWSMQQLPNRPYLRTVWGLAPNDVLIGGTPGTPLYHFDGTRWSPRPSGTTESRRVIAGTKRSDIWSLGDYGEVAHFDGERWSVPGRLPSPTSPEPGALCQSSAGPVTAAGPGGTTHRYEGGRWFGYDSPSSARLLATWGTSPSDVWFAGRFGSLVHFDGTAFKNFDPATREYIAGLGGSGPADVHAVGLAGLALHYDGKSWRKLESSTKEPLSSVRAASPNFALAVGRNGTVLRYDGKAWQRQPTASKEWLYGLWLFDEKNAIAVGTGGAILRRDGTKWESMESGTREHLTAVWATGPDDAYAVGHRATALHWNGKRWAPISAGLETLAKDNRLFHGVWGSGPKDVWAVSSEGIIVHYDGKRWRTSTSRGGIVLTSVFVAPSGEAFAAGWDGTILQRKPKP
ncbi:MAG: hypothetical protein R3B13_09000 [Polyangiaceae bacterium]